MNGARRHNLLRTVAKYTALFVAFGIALGVFHVPADIVAGVAFFALWEGMNAR